MKKCKMELTTVSSKFQVVIPQEIRQLFKIEPGQRIMFIPYQRSIRLVIVPTIEEAEGMFKGMDTHIERDEEDRV